MLTLWTVYDHPLDYPDHYVVRPFMVVDGTVTPGDSSYLYRDLDLAREWLHRMGLFRLERSPEDDPTIVETWV